MTYTVALQWVLPDPVTVLWVVPDPVTLVWGDAANG